jgi:hypothetical protein
MSKLQEKSLALNREHPALQKFWGHFALLDPDPIRTRILIHNTDKWNTSKYAHYIISIPVPYPSGTIK